jgi:DNA-binding ferritin-like protein
MEGRESRVIESLEGNTAETPSSSTVSTGRQRIAGADLRIDDLTSRMPELGKYGSVGTLGGNSQGDPAWHMSGPNFRDYHLLLDEQSEQIFAMTDDIAEQARKIGGVTIRSIGDITRHQRLRDNNDEFVAPLEMMAELSVDNQQLTRFLRAAHQVCDEHGDIATASLIETWTDETERRTWFLSEIAGVH